MNYLNRSYSSIMFDAYQYGISCYVCSSGNYLMVLSLFDEYLLSFGDRLKYDVWVNLELGYFDTRNFLRYDSKAKKISNDVLMSSINYVLTFKN